MFSPESLFKKLAKPPLVIDPNVDLSAMSLPLSREALERLPKVPLVIHAARIRVGGELDPTGRFVIGLVESDPPLGTPQRRTWPIRTWGVLQDGFYHVAMPIGPPGLSEARSKLSFARGKASLLCTYGQHPRGGGHIYWRLEFGALRGRPPHAPDPNLIGNILQWMRGRLRQGDLPDELTEQEYVLYRWADRYGPEDELLEGDLALVRALVDPARKQKRSIESGVRWLRTRLKPTRHTWATLKQLACSEDLP
jgi:hypothetical protein